MSIASKPDKAITPQTKAKAQGVSIFSIEFMKRHTDDLTLKLDKNTGLMVCKYDEVLDPNDLLINNLVTRHNINIEFERAKEHIIKTVTSKKEALDLLNYLNGFSYTLKDNYGYGYNGGTYEFLTDDIKEPYIDNFIKSIDKNYNELDERLTTDELKKVFLLRHYYARLEDLRKFIIDQYDLINFFKRGKTETHKQLFIGRDYICTIPSNKQKEAKELVTGFLAKGVNKELLKDYVKVNLEIL